MASPTSRADNGCSLPLSTLTRRMRVLLIEDDEETANYVVRGLRESAYSVDHSNDGRDGLFMATENDYDALVVDRMLPGIDGLSLLNALRANGDTVPVLILSALGNVDDRVAGLKAGGDDYLVKPFAFTELLARLESITRRHQANTPDSCLELADMKLDLLSRQVTRGGRTIDLQPREFRLLEYLLQHSGQVVTRTMLLEGVWDYHFDPQTNVVDVHISRLRQKIDKGFERQLIHTVRGAGYRLSANED